MEMATKSSSSANAAVSSGIPPPNLPGDGKAAKKRKRRRANKKKTISPPDANSKNNNTATTVTTNNFTPITKNKNKKKNNKKHSSSNGKDNTPVVQLPHVKITLRNICDTEKNGNPAKVCSLVEKILDKWNKSTIIDTGKCPDDSSMTKLKNIPLVPFDLDKASIENILRVDTTSTSRSGENKESKSNDDDGVTVEENEGASLKSSGLVGKEHQPTNTSDSKEEKVKEESKGQEILHVGKDTSQKNVMSVRILYVTPPRKSRRRGEIPGCAYLVLFPPMPTFIIEKLRASTMVPVIPAVPTTILNTTSDKVDDKESTNMPTTKESNDTGTSGANVEEKAETNTNETLSLDISSRQKTTLTAADRSKALAQSRLLLQETVASLIDFCSMDAKKEQIFYGVQVENSRSQKIWKAVDFANISSSNSAGGGRKLFGFGQAYLAKYDSTIEQNEDFKNFMEAKQKEEEERQNRPKPQPGLGFVGGGLPSSIPLIESNDTADDTKKLAADSENDIRSSTGLAPSNIIENGQQLSAIVLHLREKRQAKKSTRSRSKNKKKKAGAVSSTLSVPKKGSSKKTKKNVSGKRKTGNDELGKTSSDKRGKSSSNVDGNEKLKQKQNAANDKGPKKRNRKRNQSSKSKGEKAVVTPMILVKPSTKS